MEYSELEKRYLLLRAMFAESQLELELTRNEIAKIEKEVDELEKTAHDLGIKTKELEKDFEELKALKNKEIVR